MNSITAKLISATIMSLVLFSYGVASENPLPDRNPAFPKYYPDSFKSQGRFQEIDMQNGTLTINATQYAYDHNVRVHTLNTEHGSISMLKPGMAIGFQFHAYSKGNKRIISEIWVLPPNALVES